MKYLILVPDGSADRPLAELSGKTPLECAKMPGVNGLAKVGEVGMVRTIPPDMAPGSDAANLSVMGFDPSVYLTGRSPLEAVSMGIDMAPTDVAFRTNMVTLVGDGAYEDLVITDHSAGDIPNEEAEILMKDINGALGTDRIQFYPGVSYRHAMIMKNGGADYVLVPPHDVLTQRIGAHLPKGDGAEEIETLMRRSYQLLKDHPVNQARIANGLNPANSIWIWGHGKKPQLTSFADKYGITGSTVAAVDLIKGIGLCAGLNAVAVEGATGTLHTNYDGKAEGAIEAFSSGKDFVYIHVEGPDECSHQGDMAGKIKALECIDEKVLSPVLAYLRESGEDFRILVVPDHRTPLALRTHSSEPVPFVLYDSAAELPVAEDKAFSEASGASGLYFDSGHALADYFFRKKA